MSSRARRTALAGAVLAIGGLFFAFALGLFRDDRPNILLITVDTLRADHLSAYGFRDRRTPHIDALAAQGALFESAHCDVTWTTPSMVSTFTGKYAVHHGFKSFYDVVSDDETLVTEILREEGYKTAAFVASYPLDSIYGLDQGFEIYDDAFTAPLLLQPGGNLTHIESSRGVTFDEHKKLAVLKAKNDSYRPDNEVTDAAAKVLETFRGEKKPFFLWVHYFGPHGVPDREVGLLQNWRRHIEEYPNLVVQVDREVSRLFLYLYALKSERKTLVILHADHGESLGEHDFVGHGRFLYEDNLRVPLIIRFPGVIAPGRRIDALVGNIDIAPTMLDAAGIDPEDFDMDGKSLFQLLRTGEPIHDEMYAETYLPAQSGFAEFRPDRAGDLVKIGARRRGLLRPPWKYVLSEAFPLYGDEGEGPPVYLKQEVDGSELYNLEKDAAEIRNMISDEPREAAGLEESLAAYLKLEPGETGTGGHGLTDEETEKLRSLGYVE